MKEERHTIKMLVLLVLGPIGFVVFLLWHATDSRILREIEEDIKTSRAIHGGLATFWTICCLVMLAIAIPSGLTPVAPVTPDYEIIGIEDHSFADHERFTVRVYIADFTEERGELVAKDVKDKVAHWYTHTVTVFIYDNKEAEAGFEEGSKCYGRATYVLNGGWSYKWF